MVKLFHISRDALFYSIEGNQFPDRIIVLGEIKPYQADIDVIIGGHGQPELINLVIENYLALEKKLSVHIIVVDSSRNLSMIKRIIGGPRVSRILILSNPTCITRSHGGQFWASNGAALAAQIGIALGSSRYAFFSHSDMIGYRENLFSFLLSKLDDNTPLAAFTQRHVLPFTGGMLWDKSYFNPLMVDWLPKAENQYHFPWLDQLRNRIDAINWIDSGEHLIYEMLRRDHRAYVCASRGTTGDYFGNPMAYYGFTDQELNKINIPIHYAPNSLSQEAFAEKYPEFTSLENAMWRKCFDDDGNVVFIHRGRGTTKGRAEDNRGDFVSFARKYNKSLNRLSI